MKKDYEENYDDPERISPLKVMKSNAGYYVGRSYAEHFGDGVFMDVPYSRESGYFSSEEKAKRVLLAFLDDENE